MQFVNDSGLWEKLSGAFFVNESGLWEKLPAAYIVNDSGLWEKSWSGSASGFIIGGYGTIRYSENGTSWTTKNIGESTYGYVCASAYGNGMFVVLTSERYVGYSTDGTSWTFKILDSNIPSISSNAYTDIHLCTLDFCVDTFIITFRDGTNYDSWLYKSTDAINWTLVKKNFGVSSSNTTFRSIVKCTHRGSANVYVAVDQSYVLVYSSDLKTWTRESSSSESYYEVVKTTNYSCALGFFTASYTSGRLGISVFKSDGTSSYTTVDMGGMTYGAVAYDKASDTVVFTASPYSNSSTALISRWTVGTSPTSFNITSPTSFGTTTTAANLSYGNGVYLLYTQTYLNNRYVNGIYRSTDAYSWTLVAEESQGSDYSTTCYGAE